MEDLSFRPVGGALAEEKPEEMKPVEEKTDTLSWRPVGGQPKQEDTLSFRPVGGQPAKSEQLSFRPVQGAKKEESGFWSKAWDAGTTALGYGAKALDVSTKVTGLQWAMKQLDRFPQGAMANIREVSGWQDEANEMAGIGKDAPIKQQSDAMHNWVKKQGSVEINRRERAAFSRGFFGEEHRTPNEFWAESGVSGVPFLGFITGLALDPLMYGGYKAGGEIGRATLKKVSTKAMKNARIARGVAKAKEKVAPVTAALQEMFIRKSKLPKLANFIDKHVGDRKYLVGREGKMATDMARQFYRASKRTGVGVDDLDTQVVTYLEQSSKALAQFDAAASAAKKMAQGAQRLTVPPVTLMDDATQKILAAMSPDARIAASTMKSRLTRMLTTEMKAGVPIAGLATGARKRAKELTETLERVSLNPNTKPETIQNLVQQIQGARAGAAMGYFPRITGDEALKYLKAARSGGAYKGVPPQTWSKLIANAKQRKTASYTLHEFNDMVAKEGLASLGGETVEQFFIRNPIHAVGVRGARSAKAVTSARFLDDVGEQIGKNKGSTGTEFWLPLSDDATKLSSKLKGKVFDPVDKVEIERVLLEYVDPKRSGVFLRGFDAMQDTWKVWTLALFKKYHLRNVVGNLWNNHLADVNPKQYPVAEALQMYRKYGKKYRSTLGNTSKAQLKAMGITTQQADDILLQAEKTGVLEAGWFSADIPSSLERAMSKGWKGKSLGTKVKKVLDPGRGNIFVEKGMDVGKTFEHNARLAHFLDRLEKGDDALTAAQSVKKFLFDYGDLTAFEKKYMKRLAPFYTWTRKNVPLQLERLYKTPEKYAKLLPLLRNRDPEDLLRLKHARPEMWGRLPVEYRRELDTVTYVPLEGIIPAGDLVKLDPRQWQGLIAEMLTPYLKTPIEAAFNENFYTKKNVRSYDHETQELLGLDIPVKLRYAMLTILPQARLLKSMNKIIQKKEYGEPLTSEEATFSATIGSVYKFNLEGLAERGEYALVKKYRELQAGYRKAERDGRIEEMRRIEETAREYEEIFEEEIRR